MKKPVSRFRNKFKSSSSEYTAIVPLMLRIPDTQPGIFHYGGLGTAFLISKWGIFLTAKHVVEERVEFQSGKGLEAWIIINGQYYTCPVKDLDLHSTADIAMGLIVPPNDNGNPIPGFGISLVRLSEEKASVGDEVFTYGYQRTEIANDPDDENTVNINMDPDYYAGAIIEHHPDGVSICKWPIYRHSTPIASGMSGGPLILKSKNKVIGVNCTGDSTQTEDIDHGTGTDIACALEMTIAAQIPGFQGKTLKELLIAEGLLP